MVLVTTLLALLSTLVALGLLVRVARLTSRVRRQAAIADQRELDLDAVARVARTLSGDDARERICEAVCEVSGATFALLFEPDESGALNTTAITGVDLVPWTLRPDQEASTTFQALITRKRIFLADAGAYPAMNPTLWAAAGRPASMLFEPVLRDDTCVGVVVVGWALPLDPATERASTLVALLAAEVAVAIERADLMARLSEQARTDPLTGLANRRVWEERLAEGHRDAWDTGGALSVALIDLDDFKRVNDDGGHVRGDRMLKACGAAWARELRASDTLARIGGDEFALVLPGCSVPAAASTIDRLRDAMPAGLSFSAGIAGWAATESVPALISRADEALYAAKLAGRARTIQSGEPT